MKKKILAAFMAVVVAVSGNGLFSVKAAENSSTQQERAEEDIQLPVANILDVDFENGDGTDKSEMQNSFREVKKDGGSLSIEDSVELNKKVANFYDDAYVYPFSQEKYEKITEAVTIECMFKYNEFWWGEREVFSNQEGGGIGLGVNDGKLIFYAHAAGSYKEPQTDIRTGEWVHAVGVVDGKTVKLYLPGRLADWKEAEGTIKYPEDESAWNFAIGGDSAPNQDVQNYSNVSVSLARIYDRALTPQEIRLLGEKAFEGTSVPKPDPQKVNLGIVTADTAAAGGPINVNLHMSGENLGRTDRLAFTLSYDPEKMTYRGQKNLRWGTTAEEETPGELKVVCTENFPTGEFQKYAATRLGEFMFETAGIGGTAETALEITDFHAYLSGEEVTAQIDCPPERKSLTIYGKDALDLNGDGVIGAGDVALAKTVEEKQAVAREAAIYPYKHAVVLTVDGAGNVWNPKEVYYAESGDSIPQKTRDAEIMNKRTNTYAMQLFNEEFATSYTAQAVSPAISAQNYTSILHGVPWKDLREAYQVTNDSAAEEYFADFGKETALYPSMFQAAAEAAPKRHMAAFAEWGEILNGMIEPDAPVARIKSRSDEGDGDSYTKSSSFSDVAEYIRSGQYQNTSIVYMQNDWMDHTGHSRGYYTDAYWQELAAYDQYYKEVIDALKETGTYEETLIVANSDHGGSRWNHGSVYSSDTDVFIGLGGQTIDSGAQLQGGTNADISALVLYGLRMEKPVSMTGEVFDKSAFLSQEEMSKKGRDVDGVKFYCMEKEGTLTLERQKSEVRAADIVLQLGGAEVESIDVGSGTILRREEADGKLKLTVSYEEQPQTLAEFVFTGNVSKDVKVEEIMLGTSEGKEVYADLENEYQSGQSDLAEAIKKAKEAEERAKQAEAAAEEARRKADEAGQAKAAAEEAKEQAEAAAEEARRKADEAGQAKAAAEEAKKQAEADAEEARKKADEAGQEKVKAEEEKRQAEAAAKEANEKAEAARAEALRAKNEADAGKAEIEKLRKQIQEQNKEVTKLTVKKKSLKVKVGKKVKIKASATTSHKITFRSGNKKIASVSKKGVVKGKKKGKAVILVKCNGVTKKVKVTVK